MTPSVACVNDALYPVCAQAASAKTRKTRKLPTLPVVWCCEAGEAVDSVLAQRPTSFKRPEFYPGKRFTLAADGTVEKPAFNVSSWFRSTSYAVCDIESLHAAMERVRTGADTDGQAAYVVHGDLAPWASPASAPRSKLFKVKKDGRASPKGLQDASRRWVILDLDHVLNAIGIDPRTGAEARLAVIGYLRGLLPTELQGVRCSWQISSSCCVRGVDGRPLADGVAPEFLGAHLRFWLSSGLYEAGRKELLGRLKAHIRAQLTMRGIEPGKAAVDVQVAIYNQAMFLRPSFEAGLVDPLPERSGIIADGRDQVDLEILDGQLAPAEAPRVRTRRELTPEEKAARSERRRHDTLLRAANRKASAPAPVERDGKAAGHEVPGIRRRRMRRSGVKEAILQKSRAGKLDDIVDLVADRRGRLPEWSNGVPPGSRRTVMLIVAGLCSHLYAYRDLRHAIDFYGEMLTGRGWLDAEFYATDQDAGILRRAEAAEADETAKVPEPRRREDPWMGRIMTAMQPSKEEMVRLRLRALRTDAVRKEIARRDAGKPTAEEAKATRAAASETLTRPWEAMGVSEATYRRRKRVSRQAAAQTALDPATAMLTERGIRDVLDLISFVGGGVDGAMDRLAEGPLSALKNENLDAIPDGCSLSLYLSHRAERIRSSRLAWVANLMARFHNLRSYGADTATVLNFTLYDGADYLRWAHENDVGDRVHKVTDLIASVQAEPDAYRFLKTYKPTVAQAHPVYSSVTVGASVSQVIGCGASGGGQSQDIPYPGRELAGCSKAMWYRRAVRNRTVAAPCVVAPVPRVTAQPVPAKRPLW